MRATFIGIGAQKCASTWLYAMLRDHPQVVVSERKELNFFSYGYENGLRWYDNNFPERPGARQVGEISPSYLHEAGVVERARRYNANLQILVSLRDPVERALSQHRHMVRLGRVPGNDLSFETALATNPTYVEQGQYYRHLTRWAKAFGRERIHATLMEDIRDNSELAIRDLYTFLDIDADHHPASSDTPRNRSVVARNALLKHTVDLIRGGVYSIGGRNLWQAIGNSGLRKAYHDMNFVEMHGVISEPSPVTLHELRKLFRPDIEALQEFLRRDLSHWLDPIPVTDKMSSRSVQVC